MSKKKSSQNKTVTTKASVRDFINKVKDVRKRKDSMSLVAMMKKETGNTPKMWGPTIIGFGTYHYKYESGREGDMPVVGFSPRSAAIVVYLSARFDQREALLSRFGKHKTGKGCIYVNTLEDIDMEILQKMIRSQISHIRKSGREGKLLR